MIIKKFKKFVQERFGSYNPIPQESPKLNQFSQGNPNGMAGTSDPKMKTVDPDDQLKIGNKRFVRDFNPDKSNNIIYGKRSKRHWRDRRKDKKIKLNELFEPRDVDFSIKKLHYPFIKENAIRAEYLIDIDGTEYVFFFIIEDEYMTIEFFNYKKLDINTPYELTGKNNMLKIITILGHLYEVFKKKLIEDDLEYKIENLILAPSKLSNENELNSDMTKRGKIYKYALDSKLKNLNPTFYTDKNEMTYKFDPTISVQKISLL